ncbi:MAG: type II secretion system minor pseudopilin [bacterium]
MSRAPQTTAPAPPRSHRRSGGIALLIVLVIIMLLITAVYLFQRRAVINVTIARNRTAAAEADALARGGLRIAEAALFLIRLQDEQASAGAGASGGGDAGGGLSPAAAGTGPGELWQGLDGLPIELDAGRSLRLEVEDAGARLNVNALVPPAVEEDEEAEEPDAAETSIEDQEEAILYLEAVLDYIVQGIEARPEDKSYDLRAIAENLIDWMDEGETAQNGRDENAYYVRQQPPYRAPNRPFLSFEEIGLVEGVDPLLLEAMRPYLTVHPIGGTEGINLNTAPPWVLRLVYSGPSGDRRLVDEQTVRQIWKLRTEEEKLVCLDSGSDPDRCVPPSEVGLGEGSIYPETTLPARARVFRVVAEARVGALVRRMEAIVDTRSLDGPQLLSWRRLRGPQ